VPELPEVETIRRDLEREAVGKRIKSVDVTGTRTIRRHKTKKPFVERLTGTKILGVDRKGKYLLLRLDSGDVLVVHLGMSGQLLAAKNAKTPPPLKHTHVVLSYSTGGQLRFVDPRTFGEVFITTPDDLEAEVPELAHLGFDAYEQVMSWVDFAQLLRSKRTKLKTLLMDQKVIAGLGNIYSDEVLFEAGLRGDRTSDTLTAQEVRRLYRAMMDVLNEAIKHRGSSLADEQYRDLFGEVGGFQAFHQVYDREGQACVRCRNPIVREKSGGRSTFYCAHCQV
jgi:formamidopyrimidine-DNA glycosylase